MIDFQEIKNFIDGKSVALVGNGHMMLDNNHGKEIDSHDVVVRMNNGNPIDKSLHLGVRTDILGLTVPPPVNIILNNFDPKYIVWLCSGLGVKIPEVLRPIVYDLEFGLHYWPLCHRIRNSCPSTGMQMFDLLVRQCNYSKMTLFGFNYGKTMSWYAKGDLMRPASRDLGGSSPAVYEHEKTYAEKMVLEFPNITILKYDI